MKSVINVVITFGVESRRNNLLVGRATCRWILILILSIQTDQVGWRNRADYTQNRNVPQFLTRASFLKHLRNDNWYFQLTSWRGKVMNKRENVSLNLFLCAILCATSRSIDILLGMNSRSQNLFFNLKGPKKVVESFDWELLVCSYHTCQIIHAIFFQVCDHQWVIYLIYPTANNLFIVSLRLN